MPAPRWRQRACLVVSCRNAGLIIVHSSVPSSGTALCHSKIQGPVTLNGAPIDQIRIRRSLCCSAKAANEMMFGNIDQLREIAKSDVAADIGVDVGEDQTEGSRRQRM